MQTNLKSGKLEALVDTYLKEEDRQWLEAALKEVIEKKTARQLFLNYSLLSSRFSDPELIEIEKATNSVESFIAERKMDSLQLSRIYLLAAALESDEHTFVPAVQKLIEVADKGELSTFLTFLHLLPHREQFRNLAVEALRTNISSVFDAIALNNPYPAEFMEEAQWNQMFLKAAFMQRPLHMIYDIDNRANPALAQIITDYAHERWAASREVDPYIWRPVGPFLNSLDDMVRLLASNEKREQVAAALCLNASNLEGATNLLDEHPELKNRLDNDSLSWADVI